MTIIPYHSKFRDSILELNREAMAEFDRPDKDDEDLSEIEYHYLDGKGGFFLGIEGKELVAMGGYRFVCPNRAELKRMRVKKEFQGQGIGTELLKLLERSAFASGAKELFLETAKSRTKTLRFYENHGYTQIEESQYGSIPIVRYLKRASKKGDLKTTPDLTHDSRGKAATHTSAWR